MYLFRRYFVLVSILDIGNTPPNKESMHALYPGVAYFPPGTQMVLIKWSLLYMSASRDVWDEDNVKDLISVFITGPRCLFVGQKSMQCVWSGFLFLGICFLTQV